MIRKQFNPNSCNQGGKQQIETLQEKHLIALINTRPRVVIKAPHPHVDANKPFSIKEKQDFTEINETYRRVQALKSGYSDSKMPKTFKMKEALKRKNKVSQFIQEQNHFNNIRALENNIQEITTRTQKNIQRIKSNSRMHSVASSIKENSRISKREWEEKSTHPLEYEWKPDSAFSKSKQSKGDTILTNVFSFDQSLQKYQTASKRNQQDLPYDHADIPLSEEIQDDDFFIYTETQKLPNDNQIQSPHSTIMDKKTKSTTNVVIPLVRPNEKMNDIKRKIYQTLMEYKLFQRDQVYQIGLAYINKNQWLDENEILQECNRISKQLYGVE
ncbi:unnamed protein product (macronuclear) [Paramecium tetraurelia]|uniref:Uncharacterized protein n=1 Tax=Paramecium tetraurelia TaxID=5888 RepID=A0D8F4_PARTE|nr:uncharacterized protein GSPATT00014267001 [Paramecium tetraurelia]CAK79321.1 unnamed protein product [Paramecium tetraurelia]|eukprot:XP_001446718.1 hypothetical protein (macronuclear) [Paramecium tetraurelia strain d4-2]